MQLLKTFLVVFFFAVVQVSVLTPLFKSLVLSSQIALLSLWLYGKGLKEEALVSLAFLLGLYFDALSNTWGAYTLSIVFFTYIYMLLRTTFIVSREFHEILLLIPVLLFLYKLVLLSLLSLKNGTEFSLSKFVMSLLIEYLFIVSLYKLKKKSP